MRLKDARFSLENLFSFWFFTEYLFYNQPIENYNEWRLLFFISFLLLVAFFVLNMFVGVVVENFHKCRESQEKEERARRAAKRAKKLEKQRQSKFRRGRREPRVQIETGWYTTAVESLSLSLLGQYSTFFILFYLLFF